MKKLKIIAIAVFIILILGSNVLFQKLTYDEVEITIDSKERVNVGDGDSEYRVYCDEEVFKNVDSFVMFKFDSSDVQKDLKVGKKYKVGVNGLRIKILSRYRNIIGIVE